MKLTSNRLDTLTSEGKKDRLVADDDQRGLYVRVVAGGSESFLAQYTYAGREMRVPLGSCESIPLKAARDATAAILGQVAQGINAAAAREREALITTEVASRETFILKKLIHSQEAHRAVGHATYA